MKFNRMDCIPCWIGLSCVLFLFYVYFDRSIYINCRFEIYGSMFGCLCECVCVRASMCVCVWIIITRAYWILGHKEQMHDNWKGNNGRMAKVEIAALGIGAVCRKCMYISIELIYKYIRDGNIYILFYSERNFLAGMTNESFSGKSFIQTTTINTAYYISLSLTLLLSFFTTQTLIFPSFQMVFHLIRSHFSSFTFHFCFVLYSIRCLLLFRFFFLIKTYSKHAIQLVYLFKF